MKTFILASLIAINGILASVPVAAQEKTRAIGTLECFVDEGSGYLVGSSKDVSCTFVSPEGIALENYIGEFTKYGLDIGFTRETKLIWSVFVPKYSVYQNGSLAGNYAGASASASLAYGLGASVLIGGLSENFALQPFKVGTQKGVNLAIGITRMQLRSVEDTDMDGVEPSPEIEVPKN